ncbi:hypothetical protein F0562_004175 [Nyssa sinensis]|uniref:Uncharacterized protein n=1 Tax=Nyssa sinensis TaxID=561372 RepID=A0A5J5BYM9_9ASTE|nr:hypothetical protein F0562_004175 [Nyssa sinensis]
MANSGGSSSLPPPMYQDLYGKRRELARVQMLEREIGFLEILADTFASEMQQLLGNALQDKYLEPPRSIMQVRSMLFIKHEFSFRTTVIRKRHYNGMH